MINNFNILQDVSDRKQCSDIEATLRSYYDLYVQAKFDINKLQAQQECCVDGISHVIRTSIQNAPDYQLLGDALGQYEVNGFNGSKVQELMQWVKKTYMSFDMNNQCYDKIECIFISTRGYSNYGHIKGEFVEPLSSHFDAEFKDMATGKHFMVCAPIPKNTWVNANTLTNPTLGRHLLYYWQPIKNDNVKITARASLYNADTEIGMSQTLVEASFESKDINHAVFKLLTSNEFENKEIKYWPTHSWDD